ncbi:hypothetical protein BD626DRAFT_441257 [Schizophyllum amplum]|uniref:Uncharacterized protein n=1 Tax=Schizophyllum amplum TaxID=97359 RepID=A0A550BUK7_9AGAR|nr:hypothetical protein BD626DRAFT_441257 [Auriculariopsis ampla]
MDWYSDARRHTTGPSRHVRVPRVAPPGGGAIAISEDGERCVVAGKESLRIVRVSPPDHSPSTEHKSAVGPGGYRVDASRNMWDGSGLKMDSASTDVSWAKGAFDHKILTSARNGELIMWDLNKSGPTKYERRAKDHARSIHQLAVSAVVHHYAITGSADSDLRVWDLRDMRKSIMRIKHPAAVRALAFSPSTTTPLQALTGLDSGALHRWDLRVGQRGQLDRSPVAHAAPVTDIDWTGGWAASAGLDSTVRVWDVASLRNAYTLRPARAPRRAIWRPGSECELALVPAEPTDTDTVEIWDVRRGWLAKWAVTGTASDGGVAGIAFGGPDALWAQHTSGTFVQYDLRECTRPLDAIPRVAAAWDPAGSLALVTDCPNPWEVPYDDVSPERQILRPKIIGEPPFRPKTQSLATCVPTTQHAELDVFVALARDYAFEGGDKQTLCLHNAQAALRVGQLEVGQTWLLLGSTLKDMVASSPEEPTPPEVAKTKLPSPPLMHSVSAPAAVPGYRFPAHDLSEGPSRSPSRQSGRSPQSVRSPALTRRPSAFRRPSIAVSSPGERSFSHVGEGALDDSDESSSGGELPARPAHGPRSVATDESDSPSPASTDSESHPVSAVRRRSRSAAISRSRGRSRSGTLARGGAPRLTRQDSNASVRTVVAEEAQTQAQPRTTRPPLQQEETLRDIRALRDDKEKKRKVEEERAAQTDRRADIVSEDEERLRGLAWTALRDALEQFGDEGDIQTCAMLALVAGNELHVGPRRLGRFLDAYLDILTRLQLHTAAAYVRKFCTVQDVRKESTMETTLYTACMKCRRALLAPPSATRGAFAYCAACRAFFLCSICRLPVRGLLFHCALCGHGGHQTCYRAYYLPRPMVEIPDGGLPESRGRSLTRPDADVAAAADGSTEAGGGSRSPVAMAPVLAGHPCATGCGHFCWATGAVVEILA